MQLSKSQYVRGLQCHKSLWLYKHRKDTITPTSPQKEFIFETGNRVGKLAQTLFPGGIEIEFDPGDYDGMIAKTRLLIDRGQDVIYEATFKSRNVLILADILVRNGEAWDLYEVKSSSDAKPQHKPDAAIQWYVIKDQLPMGKAHIVHVNSDYVFTGELDVSALFSIRDITDEVLDLQAGIGQNLASMEAMLQGGEPEIRKGPQCTSPYECDFKDYCWRDVPYPSVFNLYRMNGGQKFELFHDGKVSYADVCNLTLTQTQKLQVDSALSGEIYIDHEKIREFVDSAVYPINFLDFETFNNAIPRFVGQKPYRTAIPFQYSLHILHEDGEIEHREFLADESRDPRPEIAARLAADVTAEGSIVAFSQATEKSIIRRLAAESAEHAEALTAMDDRFIDLLKPFQQLMYYHPDFHGSFSIKSILPAMFPDDDALDYKNLDIQAGDMASAIYADLDQVNDIEEKRKIRNSLLAYCRLDTLAMVMIWRELGGIANL
ncbi:MAG: DUF2779 domain-containing protein [Gammaproteobacteria bacterium]|nr:MAG: DUF2779 domain-containing protein [Gammaproteobacteria bacterium]UCH40000.1 MAG: DUF2779 domain-containing protein [Gammaproteobacteria bacterium]